MKRKTPLMENFKEVANIAGKEARDYGHNGLKNNF